MQFLQKTDTSQQVACNCGTTSFVITVESSSTPYMGVVEAKLLLTCFNCKTVITICDTDYYEESAYSRQVKVQDTIANIISKHKAKAREEHTQRLRDELARLQSEAELRRQYGEW